MPELPEVQSLVNSLNASYAGKTLLGIKLRRADIRFPLEGSKLEKIFSKGVKLVSFQREGKQLIIETERGRVNVGLGMTGGFFPSQLKKPLLHEHVSVLFDSGEVLGFVDPRRFGFWKAQDADNSNGTAGVNQIGTPSKRAQIPVDPLNARALEALFVTSEVSRKRCSVKDLLMNQRFIGGIGNIYALEALFDARIHPQSLCCDVSQAAWKKLAQAIPPLLNKAIEAGGSSIATYRSLEGAKGGFQNLHRVYGKEGEKCKRRGCPGNIVRIAQGGRSSWYCDTCQIK